MYKNTPKPLSGYTSLKRKWQDSTDDEGIKDEELDSGEDVDMEEDDISEDSEEHSVEWLLALLKESSMEPSLREQFHKLLQESLLNSLQALQKELTTIKELVDALCSQASKLDSQPLAAGQTRQTLTPKLLEFS